MPTKISADSATFRDALRQVRLKIWKSRTELGRKHRAEFQGLHSIHLLRTMVLGHRYTHWEKQGYCAKNNNSRAHMNRNSRRPYHLGWHILQTLNTAQQGRTDGRADAYIRNRMLVHRR